MPPGVEAVSEFVLLFHSYISHKVIYLNTYVFPFTLLTFSTKMISFYMLQPPVLPAIPLFSLQPSCRCTLSKMHLSRCKYTLVACTNSDVEATAKPKAKSKKLALLVAWRWCAALPWSSKQRCGAAVY
jgi:hypothetical protein